MTGFIDASRMHASRKLTCQKTDSQLTTQKNQKEREETGDRWALCDPLHSTVLT